MYIQYIYVYIYIYTYIGILECVSLVRVGRIADVSGGSFNIYNLHVQHNTHPQSIRLKLKRPEAVLALLFDVVVGGPSSGNYERVDHRIVRASFAGEVP